MAAKPGSPRALESAQPARLQSCVHQMRCTEPSEMPIALAIARPVLMSSLVRQLGERHFHHPRGGFRRPRPLEAKEQNSLTLYEVPFRGHAASASVAFVSSNSPATRGDHSMAPC
jgi:hypothetical protein